MIFFNKELVRFSIRALVRAIPSLLDGLKTSQCKVLFAALEGGLMGSQNMVNKQNLTLNFLLYASLVVLFCIVVNRLCFLGTYLGLSICGLCFKDNNLSSR